MPVVIDEQFLPATLTAPPMTDLEFEAFSADHPDCSIEVTAEGELILMPPAHWFTGARSGEVLFQLAAWLRQHREGAVVDSSGGFRLPNGARRSADAAWISSRRIEGVAVTGRGRTWLLCPNFVAELKSESDRLPTVRRKMREWIQNGVELAWLIDPDRRAVEVYRAGAEPLILTNIDRVDGEGPLEGFTMDLKTVWNPITRR